MMAQMNGYDANGNLLQSPTLIVAQSETGEIWIAMKEKIPKDPKPGCESVFYLVEMRRDRWPPDKVSDLEEAWDDIKEFSKAIDMPLYDMKECTARVNSYIRRHVNEFEDGHSYDITIHVTEMATRKSHELVWTIHLQHGAIKQIKEEMLCS